MAEEIEKLKCTEEDDEDNVQFDMEVAFVFFQKGGRSSGTRSAGASPHKRTASVSSTQAKYNYSPFRPSTVITNVSRGNVRTTTPGIMQMLTIHQMAAQGELLLLKGELADHNVNEKDSRGMTLAMWAAANNQVATLKFLQEQGADFSVVANQGETALLLAAAEGHTQVIHTLLNTGVNINHVCENGNSALCYAVFSNHMDSVRLLLEWGANITLRNKVGHCAIDIAILQENKEVQIALEKHMLSLLDPT